MRPHRLPQRPLTAALIGVLVATAVAGCGAGTDPDAAEVAAVVDGKTLDVLQDGTPVTIHLLGIDAPVADECLSSESAAALAELLPVGTTIRLDRGTSEDAAGVYAEDVLVNAELVRLGLALVAADADGPIADEVTEAQQEAMDAEVGLFGTEADCTVPAQVAALEGNGSHAADAAGALAVGVGIDEIDRRGAAIATVATTGAALVALLDGDASARYPSSFVAALRGRTAAVNERLVGATTGVQEVRAAEEQRIEAERVEAERVAAEAARVAEEAAAAEAARAAREAAAAEAAAAAAAKKATTSKAPAAAGGSDTTGGSTSTYYKNCDAVRAAGADPILAGQPGYSSKLDRDGDGIACEK